MEEGPLEGNLTSPPFDTEHYGNLIKRERSNSPSGSCHQANEASGSDGALKRHTPKGGENKWTKNEKNKCIIFSTLLRYKKYLTKKGNTYFDFNQTNLELNEKELLLQSSNYFHLFDLSSLFYPHVYVNVNSHMSVNISNYLNYVKGGSQERDHPVKGSQEKDPSVDLPTDASPIMQYATRQEFILEAIQKVEHIEVFKKVQLVKKLLLTVNREVAQKVQPYVDNIPEVNPNDYICVQTNRQNDLLFGYVKSSKFNLIFEVFNFKKFFKKCHEDNIGVTLHEVKDRGSDGQSFVERLDREEGIYLKEQPIHVKRELYQNVKFCSAHYCDYYFFKNAPVECLFGGGEKGEKKIFTFSLCLKYVKNHLFVLLLFSCSPPHRAANHITNAEGAVPNLDEMDMHNKHFNLNESDKNVFKRNTFFVHNLYDQLRCKILGLISFASFPPNDYIVGIHLTKLKRCSCSSSPGGYSFNVYCLSNGGVIYIFLCTLMRRENLCEDSFQMHVCKYYHFELRRKGTYHSVKVVECSSAFLHTLLGGGLQRRTGKKANQKRSNPRGEQLTQSNRGVAHILEEETAAPLHSDNRREAQGDITSSRKNPDGKKPTRGGTQMEKYKLLFFIITSKCDLFVVTFRRRKKGGELELLNYSCTNCGNPNHIIRGVLVNKHHFGKADEGEKGPKGNTTMGYPNGRTHQHHRAKQPNRSCSIFELLCYLQNGGVKKYSLVCTAKEQHLEFFLTKNEMPRGELLCKKQFFIPILFPFNEEVLKRKKKKNDNSVTLYNTQASYFKSIFFIYHQEKQYENVSLCVNDQCLLITYVKSICKLLRQIRALMGRAKITQGERHTGGDVTFHDQVGTLEMGGKGNSRSGDADLSPNERTNCLLGEDPLNGNLFTHREHKTHFWEYRYILFGFYDLFLINQNNSSVGNASGGNASGGSGNPGASEKGKTSHTVNTIHTANPANSVNAYDAHSHFNFLNIVKDCLPFDDLARGGPNAPCRESKRKVKMNFYLFLQTLIQFQANYISEGNSFFHLIFEELCQENGHPGGANHTPTVGRKSSSPPFNPIVDIRTHFCVLFAFLIHMYNFCLKKNGIISSDSFSSHITYFLISKKTRRNRKRFRYVYGPGAGEVAHSGSGNGHAGGNASGNENGHHGDHAGDTAEERANLLPVRKCLYYISKVRKYLHYIFSGAAESENADWMGSPPHVHLHVYPLLYLCQVLYIMLNTLRINNTNLFINLSYDLRKNNLDYFYLLLLLNFYGLHDSLISPGGVEDPLSGGEGGEEDLHQFFGQIFQKKKIPNGDKTNDEEMEGIEIDEDTFERHQVMIHNFIKRITSGLKEDHYVVERIYFKINCVLCGKACVSNLYNNYYICEERHIFNKCMVTLCCISKSSLVIPSVYLSRDLSKPVFEEPIGTLQFNLRVKLDCPYFCSFCHLFMTTQNGFFAKHFLFKQCPFCNHHLVAV
ncbi:hypothetical protein, conserved [Plasmodium vivax]|uniref:Uncharacterized protein n=1 Tax=Plasmodium vivax (strain Salvador I) TaxID=126793 RepID=A5K036_PLAVS|nr:hypothetical protein, conserved [Plasmodium vivax]EDL47597.1 hypothetical protein, conserved [Plasmodium vivax]|eukprot:XP_001617324.1 hypothetical protein [Plasmodium vivax Sal-1]